MTKPFLKFILNIIYGYVIASGLLFILNDDPITQYLGTFLMGVGIGSIITNNNSNISQ